MKRLVLLISYALVFLFLPSLYAQTDINGGISSSNNTAYNEYQGSYNEMKLRKQLAEVNKKIFNETKILEFLKKEKIEVNRTQRRVSYPDTTFYEIYKSIEKTLSKSTFDSLSDNDLKDIYEQEGLLFRKIIRIIQNPIYIDYEEPYLDIDNVKEQLFNDYFDTYESNFRDYFNNSTYNKLRYNTGDIFSKDLITFKSIEEVEAFKEIFSGSTLFPKIKNLENSLSDLSEKIDIEINNRDAALDKLLNSKLKIEEELEDENNNINRLAIQYGLPLFCGTIIILFLGPFIIRAFSTKSDLDSYSPSVLLELITVLLLTMSILILGLGKQIEGEVLGTLLGGISGYVLNRIRSKHDTVNKNDKT